MRRTLAPLLAMAVTLAPALALEPGEGTPLTAEQFDALSIGKTLFYNSEGEAFGTEQYLPNRQVRWAFVGDECQVGHWYQEAEFICFVYDFDPTPQCWTFYSNADGLSARFKGNPTSQPLVAVRESTEPLACTGPEVGV